MSIKGNKTKKYIKQEKRFNTPLYAIKNESQIILLVGGNKKLEHPYLKVDKFYASLVYSVAMVLSLCCT